MGSRPGREEARVETGLKPPASPSMIDYMSVVAVRPPCASGGTAARHSLGLLDRPPFFEHLQRAIGRADGLGGELALLAMALDPFFPTADPPTPGRSGRKSTS